MAGVKTFDLVVGVVLVFLSLGNAFQEPGQDPTNGKTPYYLLYLHHEDLSTFNDNKIKHYA